MMRSSRARRRSAPGDAAICAATSAAVIATPPTRATTSAPGPAAPMGSGSGRSRRAQPRAAIAITDTSVALHPRGARAERAPRRVAGAGMARRASTPSDRNTRPSLVCKRSWYVKDVDVVFFVFFHAAFFVVFTVLPVSVRARARQLRPRPPGRRDRWSCRSRKVHHGASAGRAAGLLAPGHGGHLSERRADGAPDGGGLGR